MRAAKNDRGGNRQSVYRRKNARPSVTYSLVISSCKCFVTYCCEQYCVQLFRLATHQTLCIRHSFSQPVNSAVFCHLVGD